MFRASPQSTQSRCPSFSAWFILRFCLSIPGQNGIIIVTRAAGVQNHQLALPYYLNEKGLRPDTCQHHPFRIGFLHFIGSWELPPKLQNANHDLYERQYKAKLFVSAHDIHLPIEGELMSAALTSSIAYVLVFLYTARVFSSEKSSPGCRRAPARGRGCRPRCRPPGVAARSGRSSA